MLSVAFFRNMNLGQSRSHSPTRPVLEGAFSTAGAERVRSFQTNGTVLFDPLDQAPADVLQRVRTILAHAVGYTDIAPSQPLAAVVALVVATRAAIEIDLAICTTFFDPGTPAAWAVPGAILDEVGTVVVVAGPGWVVTRVAPGGDPTTAVQRHLGQRATTRGYRTVERLLRAAGAQPE